MYTKYQTCVWGSIVQSPGYQKGIEQDQLCVWGVSCCSLQYRKVYKTWRGRHLTIFVYQKSVGAETPDIKQKVQLKSYQARYQHVSNNVNNLSRKCRGDSGASLEIDNDAFDNLEVSMWSFNNALG